jgi:hypothetical protein
MTSLNEELDKGTLKNYIDGEIELSFRSTYTWICEFYEFVQTKLTGNLVISDENKYELFKDLDSALDTFVENSNCNIKTFIHW